MDKNFKATNEPIIDFEPGSEHRELLLKEIERQSSRQKDIPIIINGKEIRTGNTKRLSNFLLWQSAYSELLISETFWPDFRESDLLNSITDYQNRQRRFGQTAEQVKL